MSSRCFLRRSTLRAAWLALWCCAALSWQVLGQSTTGGATPVTVPGTQDALLAPPATTSESAAPISAAPPGDAPALTDQGLGKVSKEVHTEKEAVILNPGLLGTLLQLWYLIPFNYVVVPLVLASLIGFVWYRRVRALKSTPYFAPAAPLPAREPHSPAKPQNRPTAPRDSVVTPKQSTALQTPLPRPTAPKPSTPSRKASPAPEPDTDLQLLPPSLDLDAQRQRIRDRYIAASFPGMVKNSRDLINTAEIIKSARLCYEAGHAEQACELLHLAIEQQTGEAALWLAWLEILFLTRQEERYVKVAHTFHHTHPYDRQWHEVAKLGLLLAPAHPLFQFIKASAASAEAQGDAQHNWRNWLQAGSDLSAEAAAADFHQRMQTRLAQR